MASNNLSIGQSALAAAQAGMATAGHNIANASTPGYSRQVVVQSAAPPQEFGYGYVGRGTEIETVKRIYSDFLGKQVAAAQSSKAELDSYYTQIRQIDNLLADSSAGLSPALQDFFNGVQDVASNPTSTASRQSMLSAGEALAGRFRLLDRRLDEIRQGVNSEITTSVGAITSYAQQLAQLNDAIQRAEGSSHGNPPNDLLDRRDLLIADLSEEIKATVVKQDGGMYNVFIGNGLPLVVGAQAYGLKAGPSQSDPTRVEAYYNGNGVTTAVSEESLAGGRLGGLLGFRATMLDSAQNSLGRIALGLAASFNAQHMLGRDINGYQGTAFFTVGDPLASASAANTSGAQILPRVLDANAMTTSNYSLRYDGSQYVLTRLNDGVTQTFASLPQSVDGVALELVDPGIPPLAGDQFLIRPTAAGASNFAVALKDPARIAASLEGEVGDNRNALLLAKLQGTKSLAQGTATYEGAYGQLVSLIGNKTHESEVTRAAAETTLSEAVKAQQAESGVNLDEEAAKLLLYQQAYQAAGRYMQIANQVFDVLLRLGD